MMMVPNRLELLLVLLKYGRLVYINNNAFFSKCVSFHQLVAILVSGCLVFHMWCAVGLDSFLDDDFSLLSFLRNDSFFCGDVLGLSWTRSIVPNYQSFLSRVLYWHLTFRQMAALLYPYSTIVRISSLCLSSLCREFVPPVFLPSFIPSDFFLANASFVRCEIRLRSISLANENANAITWLCKLSQSSKPSLTVITRIFFFIRLSRIDITSSNRLPSLDISEAIRVSSFFIFFSNIPSFLLSTSFIPLIVSSMYWSTSICLFLQ